MKLSHILQVTALVMLLSDRALAKTKRYNGFTLNNNLACHKRAWPPMSEAEMDTRFFMYTPSYPKGVVVHSGDMYTMLAHGFNKERPTHIFTHGYRSDSKEDSSMEIYHALVDVMHANVFAVDWRNGAHPLDYHYDMQNIRVVGNQIAIFAEALGQDWGKIYLAGHSLGAHASGYAGEAVKNKYGVTVPRITGLDPAGHGFTNQDDPRCRLDPSDAHFVDNIHTNDHLLGTFVNMGHVDFYPNGGVKQPGCNVLEDFASCSHSKVKLYYAESIRDTSCKFTSYPCPSWHDYKHGECVSCGGSEGCCNYMGYHATQSCTGTRYVKTNEDPPYCIS